MTLLSVLSFVKKYFLYILVVLLLAIILLQRCSKPVIPVDKPIVKRDTVWVVTKNTVVTQPTVVKTIPGVPGTNYVPDPEYKKLVLQYQDLVKKYIAKNIHKDSIKIDSIGYVNIEDTVSHNLIKGRKTSYNLKYPIITNTITLPPIRKNQLYYGGGVEYKPMVGEEINLGLLLKTKSDQIYSIYGGVDSKGNYQVGVQSYWKIKLHK